MEAGQGAAAGVTPIGEDQPKGSLATHLNSTMALPGGA